MSTVREVLDTLLLEGYCMVHINPLFPGVVLPGHLRKNPTVTLKLSHHFAGIVSVTDSEIAAELIFGGSPFTCIIPIDAVWGVTSSSGVHTTWDDKAPDPVLLQMLKGKTPPLKEVKVAKGKAPFLKRVK